MAPTLTERDVIAMMDRLSNWGRWGAEDELGTVNLITPAKRAAAAALVDDGRERDLRPAHRHRHHRRHHLAAHALHGGLRRGPRHDSPSASCSAGAPPSSSAWSSTATPSPTWTRPPTTSGTARSTTGARAISSPRARGRGRVRRSAARRRGEPRRAAGRRRRRRALARAGEGVMPEDLEAAEHAQGVRVESGRHPAGAHRLLRAAAGRGPAQPARGRLARAPRGLLPWLRERGVAMLGTDTHNDVGPLTLPGIGNAFHVVGLVAMGLWLIDNGNLEAAGRGLRRAPALGVPPDGRPAPLCRTSRARP